jgi:hypothetical protein
MRREFWVKGTHKEAFVDGGDEIALEKDANFLLYLGLVGFGKISFLPG